MLNALWVVEEHVYSQRIDYTCTTSGMEQVQSNWTMPSQDIDNHTVYQVTGTVFGWGHLSEGNTLIEDIFPRAISPLNFEPTCFIDGCYDWT